jgi:hypothetical protein
MPNSDSAGHFRAAFAGSVTATVMVSGLTDVPFIGCDGDVHQQRP